jgi:hypothetical protein
MQRNPSLHTRWARAQDLRGRVATIRRILRRERQPVIKFETSPRKKPSRRARSDPPLWFVGPRQRDDLKSSYLPVPSDHAGTLVPELLNRSGGIATEIEVRVGPKLVLPYTDAQPFQRATLQSTRDSGNFYRIADLFGGQGDLMMAKFEKGPGKEYRYEASVRYTYNGRPGRFLVGELWGTAKRGFYRFKPARGRASPIY